MANDCIELPEPIEQSAVETSGCTDDVFPLGAEASSYWHKLFEAIKKPEQHHDCGRCVEVLASIMSEEAKTWEARLNEQVAATTELRAAHDYQVQELENTVRKLEEQIRELSLHRSMSSENQLLQTLLTSPASKTHTHSELQPLPPQSWRASSSASAPSGDPPTRRVQKPTVVRPIIVGFCGMATPRRAEPPPAQVHSQERRASSVGCVTPIRRPMTMSSPAACQASVVGATPIRPAHLEHADAIRRAATRIGPTTPARNSGLAFVTPHAGATVWKASPIVAWSQTPVGTVQANQSRHQGVLTPWTLAAPVALCQPTVAMSPAALAMGAVPSAAILRCADRGSGSFVSAPDGAMRRSISGSRCSDNDVWAKSVVRFHSSGAPPATRLVSSSVHSFRSDRLF